LIETEAETNANFLPQTLKLLLEDILARIHLWDDTLVIPTTFEDRDPFSADPNIQNIMMGVNADIAVNVDRARARRYCPQ